LEKKQTIFNGQNDQKGTMQSPSDPQKGNPDSVDAEIGVQGIEALPSKVDRYGKAKSQALDVVDYMQTMPELHSMAAKVRGCGDYLVFRHYFTVDLVRLHGASLCKKHLLCPLCAIRRGAKALSAYLQRWEVIHAEKPHLKPFLITLTVKDGEDLGERFKHLHKAQHELWKRKLRGRGSVLDGVTGAVWSYEIKRGSGSGSWHPHLHMIALAENMPDQAALSAEWHNITGDSFIVDVRPISQEDPASGFIEVFKYAVKFSEQEPADTVHAWVTLASKRLLASSGCFRGVVVPESLLDDPEGLEELPYIQLFYRYLHGAGYSLANRSLGAPDPKKIKRPVFVGPPSPVSEAELCREAVFDRLYREKLTIRRLPRDIGKGYGTF
jgi:hypothetical protein